MPNWFDSAHEHYSSPDWLEARELVLKRAAWECEAKLPGCMGKAEQVHHTTYDHFGNEPLWDLRAVCDLCHVKITEMDRQRRARQRR
jgi:hypothetical protein